MSIRYLRARDKKFPVTFEHQGNGKIAVTFKWFPGPQWTALKDEIKAMRGARWNKDNKVWTIEDCQRNDFVLSYLDVDCPNPYQPYRDPLPLITSQRPLLVHQLEMLSHVLYRRRCILAAEMGTGKTLVIIEALECLKPKDAWYIAPKFAIQAIELEFKKWGAKVWPLFISYDEMKKEVKNWHSGDLAPNFICFDESAQVKTAASQRSQCAQALADGMRTDHLNPTIILMSGAPAPKSPKDWWKQCEIACPGYLRESNPADLEARLAIMDEGQSLTGGTYKKPKIWLDDERKCKKCGEFEDYFNHDREIALDYHPYEKSKNEVRALYTRMRGLVYTKLKKDCLDLPDKIYRTIQVEPTPVILRQAKLIRKGSKTTIEALTRMRELSDGFLYDDTETEEMIACNRCCGTGEVTDFEPEELLEIMGRGLSPADVEFIEKNKVCPCCNGAGEIKKVIRTAQRVKANPKIKALESLLEENEDNGRIVIYAGFTAAIDLISQACIAKDWQVIRVDGQSNKIGGKNGMWTSVPMEEPLLAFQDKERKIPKIAFVAHPATAKTALTLTEAYMLVYFSNTFVGDDRIQSEDRIHRIGMDVNKGAIIVDILHLPADVYVLNNLKMKRKLQGISLGQLEAELAAYDVEAA